MAKKQDEKIAKLIEDYEQKLGELTLDLQRTRADFENYRKRVEVEKKTARASGRESAILQLLPIIDTVERATAQVPKELVDNAWVQGIIGLTKKLDKITKDFGITKIDAKPGTPFNPELHEAVQFDEASGENEVVADELQTGYTLDGRVIRHSMVKVTRQ